MGSEVPPITVKVAVPVTTELFGLVRMAVIVVVPLPTPVARPPALIVAICVLLELQATCPVKFSVAPDEAVPMAMNWLVSPGDATDWEPGMMVSEAGVLPPPPPLPPVTVIVAVVLAAPGILAVIVVVPAETAVASPEEFTVATAGVLEAQVTRPVTSWELDG
jgi:hypothetical protein